MKACIVAVGSEMLTPFRQDTNSLVVTERLNQLGIDVRMKVIVGDDREEMAGVVRAALDWADVIVLTGGLGPTADDLTREAVAEVLGTPLEIDEAIVSRIRDRMARAGFVMADINRRQAMVPRGAAVIDNPRGTAPGLWLEHGRTSLILLPGPPREMTPMFEAIVRERLAPRAGEGGLFRRVVKIAGRTESDVDARAEPIYRHWRDQAVPIATTILAAAGQIELHLSARAATRAEGDRALDAAVAALVGELGPSVFSVDGRQMEEVVGDLLRTKGLQVAVAESCTGGLLASRLTDVPGSSAYVERGVVCYSNRAKVELLGVPEQVLAAHGAVSEPVARLMAEGVRARAASQVGIGITGIAGPGGGTAEKPVGTVVVAVQVDDDVRVRTFTLFGDRTQVKFRATQAALNMLRLMLTEPAASR
jgi:nicotinamide-nucleotide amidase